MQVTNHVYFNRKRYKQAPLAIKSAWALKAYLALLYAKPMPAGCQILTVISND